MRFFAPFDDRGRLSYNFHLTEFTKSDTAHRLGIENRPDAEAQENLYQLVQHVLQPARDALNVPIRVTSGYRGPALNRAVGGAKRSDHMHGRAADIETRPESAQNMWVLGLFIQRHCEFKQLIWEFGGAWIHVSYHADHNRKQVLEAYRDGDRTRYRPFDFEVDINAPIV